MLKLNIYSAAGGVFEFSLLQVLLVKPRAFILII